MRASPDTWAGAKRLQLQACYSPDEKFVLTGTSAEGKDSSGSLIVLDAQTLEKQGEIAVDGSAVAVQASGQLLGDKQRVPALALVACWLAWLAWV